MNEHKLLSEKAYNIYADSDLVITTDGETYAVYCSGHVSSYNLMQAGMSLDKLEAFFLGLEEEADA